MLKIISLAHRKPGTSREEFASYWIEKHAPLVKTCLPGLRWYALHVARPSPDGSEPEFDGVIELGFDDEAALTAAMSSPAWLSPEREASSSRFLDMTNIVSIYSDEEHIVV
jgi:uncharacterized protein (TIGR02118 family)